MTALVAPIVVGIDGSPESHAALSWALSEATRRHAPVRLVNAYGSDLLAEGVVTYATVPIPGPKLIRARAKRLVDNAARVAAEQAPDVVATTEIVGDRAAHALITSSANASLVVVGSRRIGPVASFVVGSVSAAVAVKAPCPVVVVRGPKGLAGEGHGVVVGVDGREGSQSALAFAFEYASRNSVPLNATLCWRPDILAEMSWGTEPPVPAEAGAILSESLAGWREKFPDVVVRAAAIRAHPVDGLISESGAEDLLVVGRSAHHDLVATMLGSVTMGVLHHASCPVAVVPEARP
jgi:nucleotide-binding universal stress UspA family protein